MQNFNTELAWAAGFFDGEGCFSLQRKGYPFVNIGQIDRQVLDRLQAATGLGTVYGPNRNEGCRGKVFFTLQVRGYEKSQAFGAMLWPYLSPIKRAQFKRMLTVGKANTPGKGAPGRSRKPWSEEAREAHKRAIVE